MLLETPIETEYLYLRSLDAGHARGPYEAWMRDPTVTRFLEVRFGPPNAVALETYIAKINASTDNLLLGLFPKTQPKRHIGNIKLGPISTHHRSAPIGIAIGAVEFWGRGLATQAVQALGYYALSVLGLDRLEAGFYAANESSQRAFRRAGFVDEGRRRGARVCEGVRMDEIVMGRLVGPRPVRV
jgi:[ribosomal protein S5]-alanine N-acetyltransferase